MWLYFSILLLKICVFRAQRLPEEEEEDGTFRRIATPPPDDLSDLSDFCIKPSSSMDEEEMKKLQENQDEVGFKYIV